MMCVSAWKPHELTQRFVQNSVAQQHLANWNNTAPGTAAGAATDANHERLYRAFSLLQTRSRTLGMGFGGRVPGRVNINTMWDKPVLQAICDTELQPIYSTNTSLWGNYYTDADVTNLWNAINNPRSIGSPTKNLWTMNQPNGLGDAPIMPPLGAGYTDANDSQDKNDGIQNTILSKVASSQTHPYLKNELLTKIYNNITTRSNSFAIWCTIGYFEVSNPGPYTANNRPILGKELGSEDGTNIRHKFFALVDRTNLSIDSTNVPVAGAAVPSALQGQKPIFLSFDPVSSDLTKPDPDTTAVTSVTVRVPALTGVSGVSLSGIYDGQNWTVYKNGDPNNANGPTMFKLNVDPAQTETATVTDLTFNGAGQGGNITLTISGKRRHSRGCIMQMNPRKAQVGNPGPQASFNYKDVRYAPVVPFVKQLD